MLIFITDNFKLDLTPLNVHFSETNSFFERKAKVDYSFPFKIPFERSYYEFFEFVHDHNSTSSNATIKGIVFRKDRFYEAKMTITGISKDIKVVIYYNEKKHDIFEKSILELPWQEVTVGDDIYQFATDTIATDYPVTPVNFVQIYDPEKYKDYEYGYPGSYKGFINHNIDGVFQDAFIHISADYKIPIMNEMRPFVYLKEVILKIFEQINYTVIGSFINDPLTEKALLYHDNSIFYTNKDFSEEDELSFTLAIADVPNAFFGSNEYHHQDIVFNTLGTFELELEVKGEFLVAPPGDDANGNPIPISDLEYATLKCDFDGTQIYAHPIHAFNGADFSHKIKLTFYINQADLGKVLKIKFIIAADSFPSLEGDYKITGNLQPLYKQSFNIKDLLPDIKIDDFIENLTDTFVLTSKFNHYDKTINFDFFETQTETQEIVDLSNFAFKTPSRIFSKDLGYKITYPDGEKFFYDRNVAVVDDDISFKAKTIPLSPLKAIFKDNKNYVQHQEATSILFFESNPNALPLLTFNDVSLTRRGFMSRYLKKWWFQNLNSDIYSSKTNIPIYIASKITEESKVFMYNTFFIVKSLTRTPAGSLFEQLDLRLFKLKSYTNAELVPTFQPPIAFISNNGYQPTLTLHFYKEIYTDDYTGYTYFDIDLFGIFSTDPQNLELSFVWEVISNPNPNEVSPGTFNSLNTNNSNVNFRRSSLFYLEGDYTVRLTVTNTEGLSGSINFIVTAYTVAPPPSIHIAHESLPNSRDSIFYNQTETISIDYNGLTTADARIVIIGYDVYGNVEGEVSSTNIADVSQLIQNVYFPTDLKYYAVYLEVGNDATGDYHRSNTIYFYVWNE